MKLGYASSSEEHAPSTRIEHLVQAEDVGFSFALISDHYHPWISAQGHNPFVWAVLGGVARATKTLRIGTGVTCPIIRIHPAILAQAAATVAAMMPGRFFFGVGTGENLNEHVLGDRWPPFDIRSEMLEEAIHIIRALWTGEVISHWGEYYTVEDARLYTLPDETPELMMAASGPKSATLAGQIADGLIDTSPNAKVVDAFHEAGGKGRPRIGQMTVCWARTQEEALNTVMEIWPNSGLTGELTAELRTVVHFEQAVKMVTREAAAEAVVCGPDVAAYVKKVRKYEEAGFDHVYFHQIGPDQQGFFDFYARELRDQLQPSKATA